MSFFPRVSFLLSAALGGKIGNLENLEIWKIEKERKDGEQGLFYTLSETSH